ncbi:MAG: hypothetical protein O9282_08925 [Flavobacterium sp.]|jgi:hypothetical protein|uniref:hypothetical protein n=1 Tax=Flavobacterium sp. TaxID=239 RepID=UPI0022C7A386|nr:hypothetical protein [Flavobacterium sp.]MCZ8091756.1 hypothetical protein [Flavobacterium sp.]MCZ8331420.1 hypothetical protein [Flavobacterium sp.]
MIKKILPFERLVYNSTLSGEELIPHLKSEIGQNGYSGKVYQNKFEIKRDINYRNSFLPLIKGEVTNTVNGSKINVKMDLIIFAKFFIIIWLGGVLLALLATLYTFFNDGESSINIIFIPAIMFVFGIVLVALGFKYESKKSINDLEKILKAKIQK